VLLCWIACLSSLLLCCSRDELSSLSLLGKRFGNIVLGHSWIAPSSSPLDLKRACSIVVHRCGHCMAERMKRVDIRIRGAKEFRNRPSLFLEPLISTRLIFQAIILNPQKKILLLFVDFRPMHQIFSQQLHVSFICDDKNSAPWLILRFFCPISNIKKNIKK